MVPGMDRIRLLVLTVMPSPYQRELFGAMAAHPGLDVRVRYYTADAPDRQWRRSTLPSYSRVLPGFALHSIARCCCLNPSIVSELRREDFDLVVVGDYFTLTAQLAMRYLSWRGIPWVLWGEAPGVSARGSLGRWLRSLAQRPVRRHAAGVAAIGGRAVEAYRGVVPSHVPVFNIPYHCDLSEYLAIPRTEPRGPVRFLFSGQLIPRKGVDVLIEAFERICERGHDARLTLLGDGPYRGHYERRLSPEWADRVRFAGFVQPGDLPRAFSGADVFVLPSRYDGWGVVVNEALAAGMPLILTSKVGALDLVEPGRNGYVVPPGNADALAAAMEPFVERPELVRRFGEHSRALAKGWTVERGAERWHEMCRTVLSGTRAVRRTRVAEATPGRHRRPRLAALNA